MTDRLNALTVVLEQDLRVDDAESLITAIRQLKGVASVEPRIVDAGDYIAQTLAKFHLRKKLLEVLEP